MTHFQWISDSQVVAKDVDESGVVTLVYADVQRDGTFKITNIVSFETENKVGSQPPHLSEAV